VNKGSRRRTDAKRNNAYGEELGLFGAKLSLAPDKAFFSGCQPFTGIFLAVSFCEAGMKGDIEFEPGMEFTLAEY
jgi:hypothetical protein